MLVASLSKAEICLVIELGFQLRAVVQLERVSLWRTLNDLSVDDLGLEACRVKINLRLLKDES